MTQKIFLLLALCFFGLAANAQNVLKIKVIDAETDQPLYGANASIAGTTIGATANEEGVITLENIPNGIQIIRISYVGFATQELSMEFPLSEEKFITIKLAPEGEHMEEVIISATRSRRTIADLPTRVEVISGEELGEKGNMKPGDIRMLLNETTGIQTQQTSATSYNSSIRIQGLDGKYTQLLKDGYPLYSGFSGGLSLLQIVPLDLQQVEVVKGASSTLYGGGAIAGLVNLVSKTPGEEREINFLLNGTSALGLDVSGFYSDTFGKFGTTLFASYNYSDPYDPADIGLTAIPEVNRVTVNPKLFYYPSENATLELGVNTVIEERTGGNIAFLEGEEVADPYFERNNTERITTRAGYTELYENGSSLMIKNSFSFFERKIEIPDFTFSGDQLASFSEIAYNFGDVDLEWVAGLNLVSDKFQQDPLGTSEVVDYNHITYGAFLQNNWRISNMFSLESGLRTDYQNEYGWFVLPRLSALIEFSDAWTMRVGGGLGYKTPTIFTEDAERIQFQNVMPIDVSETEAERSLGANFDINYRTDLFEVIDFSVNTLFFYTRVNDPIMLTTAFSNGFNPHYVYDQPDGYLDTQGVEANFRFKYGNFKLFTGYTLADVNQHYNGETYEAPLVAQHRLNNVLVYEIHEKLVIGLEGYYFGEQKLEGGMTGQDYWIFGLMTEKKWDNFSLFLNFENFTDTRQTRFDDIYTGSISDPQFRDIYAPVDGFVINGGIKINL
ncbi:TonB-dependent receptor [Salinimicrobium sediminilitoris]|uniref:TonB-dependent receptor n=1 Tax=Salinimicrobium sediminilitoris TaxID=2876715 RepID=UPI001E4C1E1F|nr:TonB-dependent receptor [Salinimicrobium sediminilitoris]MCC8358567.1 TonB-dependent receptor [Salinimicrobium sediminilitoris]